MGCAYCYSAAIHKRWGKSFTPTFHENVLQQPVTMKRALRAGQRVFLASMGDIFDPAIKAEDLQKVFVVCEQRWDVTFLLLTKRPERMLEFEDLAHCPPPNCWLGVTFDGEQRSWKILETFARASAGIHALAVAAGKESESLRWISIGPALHPPSEWAMKQILDAGVKWAVLEPLNHRDDHSLDVSEENVRAWVTALQGAGIPCWVKHGQPQELPKTQLKIGE
jgi:DNA repair photolyase